VLFTILHNFTGLDVHLLQMKIRCFKLITIWMSHCTESEITFRCSLLNIQRIEKCFV